MAEESKAVNKPAARKPRSKTTAADAEEKTTVNSEAVEADQDTVASDAETSETVLELPSEAEVESIIKSFVIGSMAVALVPVPAFDAAAIIALQVKMVHSLTTLYNVPFNEKLAQRLMISLIGGAAPVAAAIAGASLLKSIPLLGTVSGTASMVVLAGAATYASGKVLAYHLDNGGDLSNVNMSSMRESFRAQFAKGKSVARDAFDSAKGMVTSKGAKADAAPDPETDAGAQPA